MCDCCFKGCSRLRRVTFGPCSLLERIGDEAFESGWIEYLPCGLVEISIPDSVCELCDCCFKDCRSLQRVTFGPSSSLQRIGVSCFEESGVEEFAVPDSVRELCDRCFLGCLRLRRVTCGPSSSLEWIGDYCFTGPGLVGLELPGSLSHFGRSEAQFFVTTRSGKHTTLECALTDKIEDVKAKIEDREGIPASQQHILFQGKPLDNGHSLLDYRIEPDSTLYLVVL